MSTIGTRLHEIRKAKGLTMSAIADALDITTSGVSNWERDRFKPRPAMMIALANVLGVDPHYLEFGDQEAPAEAVTETQVDTEMTVASILANAKAQIAAVTKMPATAIKLDLNFSA